MIVKRKITRETALAVYERDRGCIIPGCTETELDPPHHAWYGGEAQYDSGRNDPDRLVQLCKKHHDICHFRKGGSKIRKFCKDYLNRICQNTTKQ